MVPFMYVSYYFFVTPKARFIQLQVCVFFFFQLTISELFIAMGALVASLCPISYLCLYSSVLHPVSPLLRASVVILGQYFSTSL